MILNDSSSTLHLQHLQVFHPSDQLVKAECMLPSASAEPSSSSHAPPHDSRSPEIPDQPLVNPQPPSTSSGPFCRLPVSPAQDKAPDHQKQPAWHKPLHPSSMILCPPSPGRTLQVLSGSCVPKSQNLTVVSPEPLASRLPSGLKLTDSTASEWPDIEAVHRATGRTLNTAWGWYTMQRAFSTETCSRQQCKLSGCGRLGGCLLLEGTT